MFYAVPFADADADTDADADADADADIRWSFCLWKSRDFFIHAAFV